MMNRMYEQLVRNLEALKLGQMQLHLDEVCDFVTSGNLSFSEGLLKLISYQADFNETNAARSMIKAGAFPHQKGIREFDFSFQPCINQQQIGEFCTLRFLEKNENIVFLGSSGVGKTHLAAAIGMEAAKKRVSTYFIKCNQLLMQLKKAKQENRLNERIKHFCHYKLLVIDEMGYLPIEKEDSNLFFQLIDQRYEKKSTILTTNINFNQWDEIFHDTVVANAILDRVLHHANVISIAGKSYRLKDHFHSSES